MRAEHWMVLNIPRSCAGYFEASPAGLDRSFYATILDTESTALPAALAGDLAMCVSDGGTDWRVKVIG